jgi:DNA polymerase-3 subunit epsilon
LGRAPRVPRTTAGRATPIVGIDVETACPRHGAVCSIGVSLVLRGAVLRERHWYLDPGTEFDPRFISIHGITPRDVRGAPRLRGAWTEIEAFIAAAVASTGEALLFADLADAPEPLFVAHNAQFDRLQIERAIGRPLPFRLACTVAMSRRSYPKLARHNLASVASHLRIALTHHDALSDARASALIAYHCLAGA